MGLDVRAQRFLSIIPSVFNRIRRPKHWMSTSGGASAEFWSFGRSGQRWLLASAIGLAYSEILSIWGMQRAAAPCPEQKCLPAVVVPGGIVSE